MRELRKALCGYIFAGINVFFLYTIYTIGLGKSIRYFLVGMIVAEGLIIISIWFGIYQTYRWGLYIYYKKASCLFKLTYDSETWEKFITEETNRRLAENKSKIKEVLSYIPIIIIGLIALYFAFKSKGDVEATQDMLGAGFRNTMLLTFAGIILFVVIWYIMGPVLFYLENIRSSNPFVVIGKRYVLLNGELYRWNNNKDKDNYIIGRKILKAGVAEIRYKSPASRFNDVTFRFPIPSDKQTEIAKYIHKL